MYPQIDEKQPPAYVVQQRPEQIALVPQGSSAPVQSTTVHERPLSAGMLLCAMCCTLCCCPCLGILAIWYGYESDHAYFRGQIDLSRQKAKRAKIWLIVQIAVGLTITALYIIGVVFFGNRLRQMIADLQQQAYDSDEYYG